jgi:broad specificity phosphatase PhoE
LPTVYFIRHGETDWNVEARLQGQRDVPLNGFGRVQSEEAGIRLRSIAGRCETFDYVASPLSRARETMERLRRSIGLPPRAYRIDERLKELSFGEWEGLTWREVRSCDPRGAAARERDKWNYVPPGGESYAMLAERIAPVLAEIDGDTVMVAHGGVARVLIAVIGAAPTREAPLIDIWQGKVLVLRDRGFRWA